MTEPTELMPCPFCGAAAHFEMDEGRWEWVECESCGMQGNRSASLMEDCKPKLAEAWNRRTPAPVGVEPIGVVGYTVHGAQYVNWLSKAPAHGTPIYTAPQPTQAQAGAVPEGWITWWPSPHIAGHEPIYSHGPKKPGHGAELDAILRKYPVFATAQPTPTARADSVLEDAARLTSEQEHAIRQGHEIAASDRYFEARPQIDSNDRRNVFQAGFERGWDAARKQGGAT